VIARLGVGVLPALLIWGGPMRAARAGGPPSIGVNVESCPPRWDREIRGALAVELGDERLAEPRTAERPTTAADRVRVHCDQQHVQVVARDADSPATLERTLAVGDLPAATAPRVVALAAVEMLAVFDPALRRRLEAFGSPVTLSYTPPADRRLSLVAGGVYRTFISSAGIHAWGGALDARRASRSRRWSVGIGFEIAGDDQSARIGQVSALLGSARASAGAQISLARDRLALSFDLGGRAGAARLSGHSDDPNVIASTVVRPWAGPVVTVTAQLGLSWFCAVIAAEAGWAAVSASGLVNDGPALEAHGPWHALSLGVGFRH
jgi:hypothetical protein